MTEPVPESRKSEVVEAVTADKQVRVYVDMVAGKPIISLLFRKN